MKSRFYLNKIKSKGYFYELGFYLLVSIVFIITLFLISFILLEILSIY